MDLSWLFTHSSFETDEFDDLIPVDFFVRDNNMGNNKTKQGINERIKNRLLFMMLSYVEGLS